MKQLLLLAVLIALGAYAYFHYFAKGESPSKTTEQEKAKENCIIAKAEQPLDMNALIQKYKELADKGDPLAMKICRYASYSLGKYNEGDKWLKVPKSASANVDQVLLAEVFKSSQPFYKFMQGVCLLDGIGVDTDAGKAFALFSEVNQFQFSQVEIALCLLKARGVEANRGKAFEMLERLAPSLKSREVAGRCRRSQFKVDDGYYRTVLCSELTESGKYPPAAIALGDIYRDGAGVDRDNAMALKFYLAAHAAKLDAAKDRMQELFASVAKDAQATADKRLEIYAQSQELQDAVKNFQDRNKSLKSMPAVLASETEKFKDAQVQRQRNQAMSEAFKTAGWLAFDNFRQGLPLERFAIDEQVYVDMATDYLSRYYRMKGIFPQGVRENAEILCERLKTLADVASANGKDADATAIGALKAIFEAKLNPDAKDSATSAQTLDPLANALADANDNSPIPETLVAESYVLLHQNDLITACVDDLKQKLAALDASTKVRTFSSSKIENDFGKGLLTGEQSNEKEARYLKEHPRAASGSRAFSNGRRLNRTGIAGDGYGDPIDSVGKDFKVIVNGESKKVSTMEYSDLKKDYEAYQSEKKRISSRLDSYKAQLATNNTRKKRNTDILKQIFNDSSQVATDSKVLKTENFTASGN